MFAKLPSCVRLAFLMFGAFVGIVAAPAANADATDACFQLLSYSKHDYSGAENEAKSLLSRNDLSRTEQRNAYMCLGQAYDELGRPSDALPAFQKVEALSTSTKELALAYDWLGGAYKN